MAPEAHVAIISARRPGAVPVMEAHLAGMPATWYVAEGEAGDYRYAGAADVVEAGALCVARNVALERAADLGLPCVQLSDDLKRLQWTTSSERADVQPIALPEAIHRVLGIMREHGAQLGGGAPTANPYFYRRPVHTTAFCVGDITVVEAGCPLRFSEELRLKEDYDYTLQHLTTYGVVARVDSLLATFTHRTNKGGAVAYRTPEAEQEAIAWLLARWPDYIKPNPRRENEVLLRWK